MTSKESLKILKQEILTPNYLTDYEKDECIEIIKQDLEYLELLKRDNQELQNRIKLSVEEHYADFMKDYNMLLKECEELNQVIKILKDNLFVYEKGDYRLSVNGSHDYQELTHTEYELLKHYFN